MRLLSHVILQKAYILSAISLASVFTRGIADESATTTTTASIDNKQVLYATTGDVKKPIHFMRLLFEGTDDEFLALPRDLVIKGLNILQSVDVPSEKVALLWRALNRDNSDKVGMETLRAMGKLLVKVPEEALFSLDFEDWEIIDLVGTTKGFTRRQMG